MTQQEHWFPLGNHQYNVKKAYTEKYKLFKIIEHKMAGAMQDLKLEIVFFKTKAMHLYFRVPTNGGFGRLKAHGNLLNTPAFSIISCI